MWKVKSSLSGSFLVLLSAICWSFSGVLSKSVPWNSFSKSSVRAVVAVLMLAASRRSFKVKITKGVLIGALGVTLTSLTYMTALNYTTSANAIVLQYAMPLFVVIINFFVFKIRPRAAELITVLLVFSGVILCCASNMSEGGFGNIMALVSGLTYAAVFLASGIEGTNALDYTYLGNLLSLTWLFTVFTDGNVHFDAAHINDWLLVLLMGVSLGLGYLLLSLGLKTASPLTAAILENAEPVLNPIWVALVIGEVPGTLALVGSAIVLVTVTLYSCLPANKTNNTNGSILKTGDKNERN